MLIKFQQQKVEVEDKHKQVNRICFVSVVNVQNRRENKEKIKVRGGRGAIECNCSNRSEA